MQRRMQMTPTVIADCHGNIRWPVPRDREGWQEKKRGLPQQGREKKGKEGRGGSKENVTTTYALLRSIRSERRTQALRLVHDYNKLL